MNEMEKDPWLPESISPAQRTGPNRLRLRDCVVDVDLDRIVAPSGEAALEPKAMAVLVYLVTHAGRVVSTSELIDAVWRGRPMGDNPVYRCIAQLRRALGDDPRAPTYIATVPTKGYRLLASVEVLDRGMSPPTESNRSGEQMPLDQPPAVLPVARPPSRRWALAGSMALLLVSLIALLWYHAPDGPLPASSAAEPVMLALLPLHTTARDEDGIGLAQSVTDMLRHHLARLPGLLVIAGDAAADGSGDDADVRTMGHRLHARFLLRGNLAQSGGRLQVDVQLLDAQSGKVLWASTLDRSASQLASIRDDIARHVAKVLHVPVPSVAWHESANLDAYRVYLRGQRLLRSADVTGAGQAVELFRRATILAPDFARAYLGLGQSLALEADAAPGAASGMREQAAQAFGRALELDPAMGEAWVAQATLARDPAQADALFRKGLTLAPSDGAGYVSYAQFLFRNSRVGEAIDVMERARRIDPLAPELCLTQAFFVMVVRNDVAEHDRLVRQALEINPRLPAALYQMAYSNWEYSGKFAQAAQVIEQAMAVEPQSVSARLLARDIYLDLGDPASAAAALGPSPTPGATTEIAQYRGKRRDAAAALQGVAPTNWPDLGPQAAKAQAIRDAAIETGDFSPALHLLQSVQVAHEGRLPMWYRGFALIYAHTQVLAGDVQGGLDLARATLALVDAHGSGRAGNWFSRERAAAYAVLGDDDHALRELTHSVENGQLYRWWYLAEHDPLYAHLRDDPRFQALNRRAMAHRDRQRAMLEAMRRGEEGLVARK